ncbi:PH domain-containing protein [Micrococcus sp.]|uniref:PH domain-containing protein n=1 Tax=Micrococcus sp. TaxID=1271 RepID=UPI002A911E2C|nr:PH domain-containing protein [Micrococcus sp.]MDY6054650.1 PH domain-containing protein [Micrococcus sp.]
MSGASPTRPEGTAVPTDEDGWFRAHPLSPLVKGWVIAAAVLVVVGRNAVEDLLSGEFTRSEGAGGAGEGSVLIAVGILTAFTVLLCLVFFFSWWFTRFRLGPEQIDVRHGWLLRSRRQMKYDRIQAVDLQHPLLARILGLAAVKVEAADGDSSALELSFLKKDLAQQVRREILDRASGVLPGTPAGAEGVPAEGEGPASSVSPEPGQAVSRAEDEGELMLQVPTGRVLASVLLSGPLVGVVLYTLVWLFVLPPAAAWVGEDPADVSAMGLATLLPVLLAVVTTVWSRLNSGWGFQVRRTRDGLRLRHGLTETTHQTVPPGRVQGVTVTQGLLWRPLGWYRVRFSVAGYGENEVSSRGVALPVGPWEDVLRVLTVLAPEPGLEGDPRAAAGLTPQRLMELGVRGDGTEGGFEHIPRRARWWWNALTWRRAGFTATSRLLLVRSGWWTRALQVLPHERLQTATLTQGPVQRRLRVATVRVSTAGDSGRIVDLDEGTARELFLQQARHAAVSRRYTDRNQWMREEELARFDQRTREVAESEVGRRELDEAGVAPGAASSETSDGVSAPDAAPTAHHQEQR